MSSNELFQLVALSIVLLVSAMHKDKALFIFNVAIRYAFLPVMIRKCYLLSYFVSHFSVDYRIMV